MTGTAIRRIVIQQSKRANVGHIGSALSVADIVAALYGGVLRVPAPRAPDRDRFVLGKGHSVLAVYAAMFLRGEPRRPTSTLLRRWQHPGVHPDRELAGIDFSTGSLGFGLPSASVPGGAAPGSDRRSTCW